MKTASKILVFLIFLCMAATALYFAFTVHVRDTVWWGPALGFSDFHERTTVYNWVVLNVIFPLLSAMCIAIIVFGLWKLSEKITNWELR